MSTAVAFPASRPRPVASWRHSATLLGIFAVVAALGALFQHRSVAAPSTGHPHVIPIYAQLLVMEWALFFFVWKRGLATTGTSLRQLIGGHWDSPRAVVGDLALAAGLLGAWKLAAPLLNRVIGPDHAASIVAYLPQGTAESVLWLALSLSAGFCEEIVFRGYFQRQFAAWTGSQTAAVILQSILFGVLHGYQGVAACARIACFGAFYGVVAVWRRNLRPGMVAHAMTDILSGIFRA